jgi:hypothetical protein
MTPFGFHKRLLAVSGKLYAWCKGPAQPSPTREKTNLRSGLHLGLKLEPRRQELESVPPITGKLWYGIVTVWPPWTKSLTPACNFAASETISSLE